MERHQISNNIIIDRIPENKTENCIQLAQQIFKKINTYINVSMINVCYKIDLYCNNA